MTFGIGSPVEWAGKCGFVTAILSRGSLEAYDDPQGILTVVSFPIDNYALTERSVRCHTASDLTKGEYLLEKTASTIIEMEEAYANE